MAIRSGTAGDDDLAGDGQGDLLSGLGGDDRIEGRGGDDTLRGNEGSDGLYGEDGDDLLDGRTSSQPGESEHLYGGAGRDTLRGGIGDDNLRGGPGGDILDGGAGPDRVFYDADDEDGEGGILVDLLNPDENTGSAAGDTFISVEAIFASERADTLLGGNGDDVLVVNDRIVLLDAPTDDRAEGRDGDDRIDLDWGREALGGAGDDTLGAVRADNTLRGGQGDDLLQVQRTDHGYAGGEDVGRGVMLLDGGAGNDTLDLGYRFLTGVKIRLHDAAIYTLVSIEAISGSSMADDITGSGAAETLIGLAGDDRLTARGERDRLLGGDGDDTLRMAVLGVVDGGDGFDLVGSTAETAAIDLSGGDFGVLGHIDLISIEGAQGTQGRDRLRGDSGANLLRGYDPAAGTIDDRDLLNGRGGDDTLEGGGGGDALFGGDGNDSVVGGRGNDHAEGGDGADTLSGAADPDELYGQAGADLLSGGDGNDRLRGGQQRDSLFGDAGGDLLSGDGDRDSLDGGDGADRLDGGTANDVIIGGAGDDRITGGLDGDTMSGGEGSDRFIYTNWDQSRPDNPDLITDFTAGDILDLAAADADVLAEGDQAFTHADAFTGVAGQLILAFGTTGETSLLADTDGDLIADLAILFTGDVTGMTDTWLL